MKMNTCALVALLFLVSCASSQNDGLEDVDGYSDEDLSWVENEDFRPTPTVGYDVRDDFFLEDLSSDDSLSRESIERAPKKVLNKVERSENPISQLISLCYQGDYKKASGLMDELYEKYKKHPGYWNQVGTCYLNQQSYNKAKLYYNKSLDAEDDYAPAINNLGVIYYREGHHQKALKAFEKASQVNQFSLTPSFNLAQIYLKFGFVDQAEDLYKALWRQSSRDKDVLNGLATVYLMKKDVRQSLRVFGEMNSDDYSDPSVGLNYAVALRLANQSEEADSVLASLKGSPDQQLQDYARRVQRFVRN